MRKTKKLSVLLAAIMLLTFMTQMALQGYAASVNSILNLITTTPTTGNAINNNALPVTFSVYGDATLGSHTLEKTGDNITVTLPTVTVNDLTQEFVEWFNKTTDQKITGTTVTVQSGVELEARCQTKPEYYTLVSGEIAKNERTPELENLVIPYGVTSIPFEAFSYTCVELKSVAIPEGVVSIGGHAFAICKKLTSINLPSSVTSIGGSAFRLCESITDISIPYGVKNISASAFNGCASLTSVSIPSSVTSIGDHVFSGCIQLTSIIIPDSVVSLGQNVFNGCSDLISISIPASMNEIGYQTFSGCLKLEFIRINKPTDSISGSPWGAPNATVYWLGDSGVLNVSLNIGDKDINGGDYVVSDTDNEFLFEVEVMLSDEILLMHTAYTIYDKDLNSRENGYIHGTSRYVNLQNGDCLVLHGMPIGDYYQIKIKDYVVVEYSEDDEEDGGFGVEDGGDSGHGKVVKSISGWSSFVDNASGQIEKGTNVNILMIKIPDDHDVTIS